MMVASSPDARASLAAPAETAVLTQLNSTRDVLRSRAAAQNNFVTESPLGAGTAPPARVAPRSSDEAKSKQPAVADRYSSLGNPAPVLPIPESARLEAGRAALNQPYGDRPAPPVAAAPDASARGSLKLPSPEERLGEEKQRSIFLEGSFLAMVLICIVGAMWYRMSSHYGQYPRRRRDWDR